MIYQQREMNGSVAIDKLMKKVSDYRMTCFIRSISFKATILFIA